MIIQLIPNISPENEVAIAEKVKSIGFKYQKVSTQFHHYLVCPGKKEFDIRLIGNLPGVEDVHYVTPDYQLVSRMWKVHDTVIDLGDGVVIRRGDLAIMTGPCSIESEAHGEAMIEYLVEKGIRIMRSMVFKPRSSPYSFRGIGIDGLKHISAFARSKGIKIISEVMQVAQVDEMADHVDIFQIGARNSQNFNLLDAVGKVDKPVLLKRGVSGTLDELLQSAEYVFSNGNEKIMLCERGIRTFENAYRNTFDVNAIPVLKEKSHLPVIADPSHGIGVRAHVDKVTMAAVMAGADGVLVEIHQQPEKAFSDGQQTLNLQEADQLFENLKKIMTLKKELDVMWTDQ